MALGSVSISRAQAAQLRGGAGKTQAVDLNELHRRVFTTSLLFPPIGRGRAPGVQRRRAGRGPRRFGAARRMRGSAVISTRELKALRGAPAARPAPSAASSTSTRRRWPTEHDHERRRHRPCPCRAGADPRRFDPPRGALERHREALVQDRLSALPPCDAPPSEHRRLHRPGVQAKLDADPELQAFVLARLDRLTFKNIAAEVAQCFPPKRRVRSSAIHAWASRRRARGRAGPDRSG